MERYNPSNATSRSRQRHARHSCRRGGFAHGTTQKPTRNPRPTHPPIPARSVPLARPNPAGHLPRPTKSTRRRSLYPRSLRPHPRPRPPARPVNRPRTFLNPAPPRLHHRYAAGPPQSPPLAAGPIFIPSRFARPVHPTLRRPNRTLPIPFSHRRRSLNHKSTSTIPPIRPRPRPIITIHNPTLPGRLEFTSMDQPQ